MLKALLVLLLNAPLLLAHRVIRATDLWSRADALGFSTTRPP